MKTIYNTYVVMESQEQCDRMKQLCIDNNLSYWDYDGAFQFNNIENTFSMSDEEDFYVLSALTNSNKNKTQITEQEFIELLNQKL